MHENMKKPNPDLHSDEWWLHVLEGTLSSQEADLWHAHLEQCEQCRLEWQAMAHIDALLRTASPPPLLSDDFTARTVARVMQKQRLQRLLSFLGGTLIITLVSWGVLSFLGATYISLERFFSFVITSRQVLFGSLMRTMIGLFLGWKTILPCIVGGAGLLFMLLMPNGILATLLLLWVSRRQSVATTIVA